MPAIGETEVSHLERKAASQIAIYVLALIAAMFALSLLATLLLKLFFFK